MAAVRIKPVEEVYDVGGTIKVVPNTSAFLLKNVGDEAVTLFTSYTLAVNETFSIGANEDEFIQQEIDFSFAGGGSNPQLVLIRVVKHFDERKDC